MRIMAAFFIVACVSMMLYVAPMALAKELGNQDVRVVLVPTNEEQVDLAPPEPRTNVRKTPSSVVNVSLSTLAEKKATVLDDSILDEDTCDAGCGDDCSGMFACRCCSQLWVRADYLLWWTRGSDIPPLVTTSTDQSDNGILGRPTTEILFGGSRQTSDARSSARITMGYWFDCCQCCGIQLDYFNLGP
ncbi:MAG: BBP7 family outer membrane beta-barrel protein, partial [Pirellulales bacterium]|nr:BBP7 family outer membrane beta-barrel protein [Pirellulales bacterium]